MFVMILFNLYQSIRKHTEQCLYYDSFEKKIKYTIIKKMIGKSITLFKHSNLIIALSYK